MQPSEAVILCLIIAVFASFGGMLAYVSFITSDNRMPAPKAKQPVEGARGRIGVAGK